MKLIEFLKQYGIDYREGGTHRHVRNGWIGVDCPHCGPNSKRFHAGVEIDGPRAACWRCGGTTPAKLLSEITHIPWWQVRDMLNLTDKPSRTAVDRPKTAGLVSTPGILTELKQPHRQYLRMRGFDPDQIECLWNVRAFGPAGKLAWRIWIPIEHKREVVSWTTRSIALKESRRYISASPKEEKINHKTLLYGYDHVVASCIVVEGPLDVWAIGPGAVALMGLQATPEQIKLIGNVPLRALCCDNEPAALKRANDLANKLQQYPGETFVIQLETGKDPAESDESEINDLRSQFLDLQKT
jgi:hypothetical protein